MGKSLVLAEKPSVGRDIAKVLGCHNKIGNSHIEGSNYVVTWALGHLVTLATPDKYNKAYETWSLDALPMIPDHFKLEVIKNTSKQYFQVRKLMERKDITEIIIATDAGREGELVARWIIKYAKCKKPTKRLWISSVTDKAIKDGFKNLKDGKLYNSLYAAAQARAEADWVVGLNGTRALTCKHNASLSMGRVQTPTLNLIYEREQAIRKFVPESFYELDAVIAGLKCKYTGKSGQTRISEKTIGDQIYKECLSATGKVKQLAKKDKSSFKTGFYDLTELQRDANKQYGFSAKETLSCMQGLYERHKVLTYPRTDSKYITKDIVATLGDRLRACRNGQNKELVGKIIKLGIKGKPSFVNDAKVGDHHGIIPTEVSPDYHSFSPKEQKIYNLVIQRFVAVLLPAYRYSEVSIEVDVAGHLFRGKDTTVIDLGWKEAYEKEATTSSVNDLSKMVIGKQVSIDKLQIKPGKTAPPSYLSEADLLGQMEKSGLGTVATRADIIEKIVNHQYVDKIGHHLRTTKTGTQLLRLVPEDIKSKELTAKWEQDLEAIAKGKKDSKTFMNDMITFTREIITAVKKDDVQFKHDNESTEKCPDCGQKLLMTENKFGKRLVCRDRNCGYKKNLSKATNARCPNCHKKLQLVGEGEKQTFICKCGHKEKLSAFNKRKQGHKSQANKREVQKYLSKSTKQEETFNNPFAKLLGDMNDDK